jgi:hypothetical protein
MNKFQIASALLTLCPIPTVIQNMIFGILLCEGTPTASIIKTRKSDKESGELEIPIHVVVIGPLQRCRHSLYYMDKTINHYYDNDSYFNKEALFELHIIYLKSKRTSAYTVRKIQELTEHLDMLFKCRLVYFR